MALSSRLAASVVDNELTFDKRSVALASRAASLVPGRVENKG